MVTQDSENNMGSVSSGHKLATLVTVFAGGYVIMALEILSFRIIYAGIDGSIIATGAILGVVLTALTLGYWAGGTLSVKLNPGLVQAVSLIIAGIWIILLAGIPDPISDIFKSSQEIRGASKAVLDPPWQSIPAYIVSHPVSDNMDIRMRLDPLLASLILFALPSFLMAMVGPCGVQILTRKASEAGRIAGWIFALGSLGSITGVILTSFFLLGLIGTSANLRLDGLVAIIFGFIALISTLFSRKN